MTIVILGGTAEARRLADSVDETGLDFVSTLAGRVARPRLPRGPVHIGGFGGVEGLVRFLVDEAVIGVVDATHPFAAGISANAVAACRRTGVPLLRLQRPGWSAALGADTWTWVDTHAEAAAAAATFARPLLTVGRQAIGDFTGPLAGHPVIARVVDAPEEDLPDGWTLVQDRGPYELAGERALLQTHDIDVLVTKDSGGDYTWPKIQAAAEVGATVVIVRRPPVPADVEVVATVDDAAAWVDALALEHVDL